MSRPPRRALLVLLLAAAAALVAPPLAAQREVPYLSGRVVDEAGIVPDDVEARIEQRLAAFEAETGSQVAVLTVGDLAGDPIEDFSLRVAETWKIGRGGVDDGVIFVVARDDRRMRIEVGYGLEPELTDLESGRILDEIVAPRFRQGEFGAGVEAGVDAILASLEGAELPAPQPEPRAGGLPIEARLLAGTIFFFVVGTFSLTALATPGRGGWFLYLFLVPFYALFPTFIVHPRAGLVMVVLWLVLFPILRPLVGRRGWAKRWMDPQGGSRRFHRGGWGGGGFGGGGASGSW
ncbi:MAG TPA: TPM domain-containing protein [Thermoanaerobaculia bacterium]